MTTEKAERIVRSGLLKTEGQGIDRQAKEAVARLFLALEMEREEERELGQVLHPSLDVKPDSYIAPPPPPSAPAEVKSSLVILPDSIEAKELERKTPGRSAAIAPLRLTRSGKVKDEIDELEPKRSVESLMQILSGHPDVPVTMDVAPDGGSTVRLTRRLEAGHGFNAVKVTYVMDGMNQPRPSTSQVNAITGESELSAMPLDIPISEAFFTWEEDLKIRERMERIRENAKKCYAPRPGSIVSKTPLRQGNLRFDPRTTPHEEA